ncbi:hypothetical protein TA3x_005214 [Tundrisphaera sp. TA3]|uniref:hypothetical protein n=1 Tax=Tundrisphaera sp. TA3 TaxID=3435775 RepID=UPI003EBF112A
MRHAMTAGGLLAISVFAGCSSTGSLGRQAVTSPVGPSYVAGKGVQVFPASPAVMSDVKDAMTDVGIHSIKQVREPDNTDVFEGTTADNRKAQVAVQPRGSKMVVTTKIGWRGDEPLSRAVLDRISIRQGTMPDSAIPVTPASNASPLETEPEPETQANVGVPDSVMLRSQLESGGFGQSP